MAEKSEPKKGKRAAAAALRKAAAARARALKKIAAAYLKALEAGKAAYKQADEQFLQLLDAGAVVDAPIDLGGGRTAVLVDQFAVKNKVWKPCGVDRFKLEVNEPPKSERD